MSGKATGATANDLNDNEMFNDLFNGMFNDDNGNQISC